MPLFRVLGLGFRPKGLGFRVQGQIGLLLWALGFRGPFKGSLMGPVGFWV